MGPRKLRRVVAHTIFCAVALALLGARGAQAETELRLGVYAYDDPNEVVWSCPAVVEALAERMGALLDDEVSIAVRLDPDYDRGVMDLTGGRIDVARFPNVETYWVVHPHLSLEVADAWRDSMVALRLEEIVARVLRGSGSSADTAALSDVALEEVEDRFGPCAGVIRRLSQSGAPGLERLLAGPPMLVYGADPGLLRALAAAHRDREAGALNALPATAAGKAGGAARPEAATAAPGECSCP